jgi:Holliday junction resolvase RusA-like endonuclease
MCPKSRSKESFVVTTPDMDNLEKAVLDGLGEITYLDNRFARARLKKYVTTGVPWVEIVISALRN